jgi:hypothetical protein
MEVLVIDEALASHRYHDTTSSRVHESRHLVSRWTLLTGWLGRSPTADERILRSLAAIAERLYDLGDLSVARPLLEELDDRSPDRRSRLLVELARRGIGPTDRRAVAARRVLPVLTR